VQLPRLAPVPRAGGRTRSPEARAIAHDATRPAIAARLPTAPPTPSTVVDRGSMTGLDRFSDLFATRDSSLALAVAALARIADEQGHASFSDLAVAYREVFFKFRAHAK